MAIQETSAGSFWWINPKPHQSLSTAESVCKQAIERVVSDWTSHKPNGYVPKVMVIHHVIHFHTFPEFWCSRVCGNLHCWRRMPVEGCMHTTCWVFLHSQDKGVWSKLDWSVNHGISLSLSVSLCILSIDRTNLTLCNLLRSSNKVMMLPDANFSCRIWDSWSWQRGINVWRCYHLSFIKFWNSFERGTVETQHLEWQLP